MPVITICSLKGGTGNTGLNVADGYHLWSETYDRRLDDIFAIQEEISLKT